MPHEDLHRSIMNGGGKTYRRRKKFQGATWTPDTETALAEDGPWCAGCRQRHGYMSKLLMTGYEKRQSVWYILWICRKTNNVIKDQALGT